jgi:Acetyltransferase (GNAT) domain
MDVGDWVCHATDETGVAVWDGLIDSFEDMRHVHLACYTDSTGGRFSRLLVTRNGAVLGGAKLQLYTLLGHGVAYCRGGPFWGRKRHPRDINALRAVLSAMVEEYCRKRGYLLTILSWAVPDVFGCEREVLQDLGFHSRRSVPPRYYVDLSEPDEAKRLTSLSQSWRRQLRHGWRANLSFSIGQTMDELNVFQQLHAILTARKSIADESAMLPAVFSQLPPAHRPFIVLARRDAEPVCGAVIGVVGNTANYIFGASTDAALSVRAGYALHWFVCNWLAARQVRWYDLGSDADDDGLRQFKTGLVGRTGVILTQGEFDY